MSTKVQIQGGAFQTATGAVVASGFLVLTLSQDAQVASPPTQVDAVPITISLNSSGNVPSSPAVTIWGDDVLVPSGTVYSAIVLDSNLAEVWGPQLWSLTGAGPIDLGTLVPTSSGVSYPSAIVTNPSGDQTIQSHNLLPSASNTSQSLGSAGAPWLATLYDADFTEIAAPSSPASGLGIVYYDSTDHRFHDKNHSGTVATTVVPDTGSSNNFLTAVSSAGLISKAQPSAANLSNGTTGSGAVVLATGPTLGSFSTSGKITSYNGIATVGNGVPSLVAAVNVTGQTDVINATNLYTPTANGLYRLNWFAKITTAAGTSSTLGQLQLSWSDPDSATGYASWVAIATLINGTVVTSTASNLSSTALMGVPMILSAKSGTAIQYSFSYASNPANAMTYALHISLEAL